MEAEELQVGDWVIDTYHNKSYQVAAVDAVANDCLLIMNGYAAVVKLDNIVPIPLTKEILEKNNCYELDDNHYIERTTSNVFNFIMAFEEYDEVIMPIKYVHELQHILKVFNIDKEIVL